MRRRTGNGRLHRGPRDRTGTPACRSGERAPAGPRRRFDLIALGDIARHLGGTLDGDDTLSIARVRGIEQAGAGEIAVVSDPRFTVLIETSHAAALVVASTCGSGRK